MHPFNLSFLPLPIKGAYILLLILLVIGGYCRMIISAIKALLGIIRRNE
jgi:hypothetical protein